MPEYAMLNDLSRCIGCRGCQVACKSWNGLAADKTTQKGTYQNPPENTENTWCLIKFNEIEDTNGKVKWLFRKTHCFHCGDAACFEVCSHPGAIYKTEEGAVVIDQDKCTGCKDCMDVCPFEIPKYDEKRKKVYKCTLCIDRVKNKMLPACAKTCISGAVQFGEKKEIIKFAKKRLKEIGGNGSLYGDQFLGGTHVMYILPEKPQLYKGLPAGPMFPVSVFLWKKIITPFFRAGLFGVIGLSWLCSLAGGQKSGKKSG